MSHHPARPSVVGGQPRELRPVRPRTTPTKAWVSLVVPRHQPGEGDPRRRQVGDRATGDVLAAGAAARPTSAHRDPAPGRHHLDRLALAHRRPVELVGRRASSRRHGGAPAARRRGRRAPPRCPRWRSGRAGRPRPPPRRRAARGAGPSRSTGSRTRHMSRRPSRSIGCCSASETGTSSRGPRRWSRHARRPLVGRRAGHESQPQRVHHASRKPSPRSASATPSRSTATGPTPCRASSSAAVHAVTCSRLVTPWTRSAPVAGAPMVRGSGLPAGRGARSRGGPPWSRTASPRGERR